MDEITCPNCGRPNLVEAVKCWYCQTNLEENPEKAQEGNSLIPNIEDDVREKKTHPKDVTQADQNIPEWLLRIRELKAADQPPEEDPNWQQRDLFPSEEKIQKQQKPRKKRPATKEKTTHSTSKTNKKDNQSSRPKHKKNSSQAIDANNQEQSSKENLDKDSENLSDELPEGFTKL